MTATQYSDYILRVKIVDIDSVANKNNSIENAYRYNVTAQVLDTIVGKTIPTLSYSVTNRFQPSKAKVTLNDSSAHFTTFQYVKGNYYESISNDDVISSNWIPDTAFTYSQTDQSFNLSVGQQAIVFLLFKNGRISNQIYNFKVYCTTPLYFFK